MSHRLATFATVIALLPFGSAAYAEPTYSLSIDARASTHFGVQATDSFFEANGRTSYSTTQVASGLGYGGQAEVGIAMASADLTGC